MLDLTREKIDRLLSAAATMLVPRLTIKPSEDVISTSLASVDSHLAGGLPVGQLTEVGTI